MSAMQSTKSISNRQVDKFFQHGRTVITPSGDAWFLRSGSVGGSICIVSMKDGGLKSFTKEELVQLNSTDIQKIKIER